MKVLALAAFIALAWLAASRAELVHHWELYTADGAGMPYRVFLEPFPDARTCEIESDAVMKAGGRAYCGDRVVVTFDRSREDRLLWAFVTNPWRKLCENRVITAFRL